MADNNSDLMAQFQEFLEAKAAKDAEDAQAQDTEIEIWNKDGSGARGPRSGFSEWLKSNGFSIDPEPDPNSGQSGDGTTGDKNKTGRKSTGSQSNATGTQSVARKYFAP